MITKPTVLVLGAGASTHCGYPLGMDLVARLAQLRGSEELKRLPNGWTANACEKFLTDLSQSAHYSIDAFLETRKADAELGKYLIARCLKECENFDTMFPPARPGWYQYLFNRLLVNGNPEFHKNQLGIITFNYDRSLEAYIHTALRARRSLDSAQASQLLNELKIVHVHGILGDYPRVPYTTTCEPDELLAISKGIRIIHEIEDAGDGFCNEMFKQANGMLAAAENIYFLGFGFHPDNIRRFKFFSRANTQGKSLRTTTIGMQPIHRTKLLADFAECGFTEQMFTLNGSSCNDFFDLVAPLE